MPGPTTLPTDAVRSSAQATYDKLQSEVPKYKMITPSVLSDRLRINGSLARAAIKELLSQGLIREVSKTHSQQIYTRATNVDA